MAQGVPIRRMPRSNITPPLELANHITVSRQDLLKATVPRTPSIPAALAPTYTIKSQPASQAATAKEKEPSEMWDLQASYLYRLEDVQSTEDLPEIWKILAPLSKEKARPAFKMACRESARALRCKAPRVTHAVAVLLLGIHFHTEDPDCVNETVNIFMFPDLSLSSGSEASMVTQRWDTALDANTLTSYADAAALMKQQHIPPIVGWEAATKMLKQWLVVVTVLLGPQEHHPAVFELATLLEAENEVNFRLRAQAGAQQDINLTRASDVFLPATYWCAGHT